MLHLTPSHNAEKISELASNLYKYSSMFISSNSSHNLMYFELSVYFSVNLEEVFKYSTILQQVQTLIQREQQNPIQ